MRQLAEIKSKTAWESIEFGMRICISAGGAFWIGILMSQTTISTILVWMLALLTGLIVNVGLKFAVWMMTHILRRWMTGPLYLLLMTTEITSILYRPHAKQGLWAQSMAVSSIIALLFLTVAAMISYRFFQGKRGICFLVVLLILSAMLIIALFFLFGKGIDTKWQKPYLAQQMFWAEEKRTLPHLTMQERESFQNSTDPGRMQTAMLTYGTEESDNLQSKTTDLQPFINGYTGLTKTVRNLKEGYSLEETPVRGCIYYPRVEKNCPVLFLIHGQHQSWVESYQGYEYLGKYLASHGYVMVTVDENALNAGIFQEVSQENDARAILLLENIKQVLAFSRDRDTPLYQKINPDKIVLAGHSRGGEAITDAALFSQQSHYPGNGNRHLPYHFSIQGLIAIAPTEGQYQPADHAVALKDINYLVLQGAEDQDVNTFTGLDAYQNISFHERKTAFKSALLIGGANHGQFNTVWGSRDTMQPFSFGLNSAQLMTQSEQQRLLQIFTKIFMDVTVRGDTRFKSLFYDYAAYQEVLPKTVYSQLYQNNTYHNIADFEEDSNLVTGAKSGALAGSTQLAEHMTLWAEELYQFSENDAAQVHENHVLHLKWKKTTKAPSYTCKFPEYDATGEYFQFDLSDISIQDNAVSKAVQSAEIVFTDKDGHETVLPMEHYALVYTPFPIESGKVQSLYHEPVYQYAMQTVRIPISDVRVKGGEAVREKASADVRHLVQVSIRFSKDTAGEVEIDNVGFSN